tara:strand:+ start:281 stop:886 length:606 start_codon:yes stop_codon:yes gene_type:complete
MADVMKHVGKIGEKPVVVVYREVPNEPDNALIVETASLSDEKHDALMQVVSSAEAQESNQLSEVLHRRTFPDGSNMLTALHYGKNISKVGVNQVNLEPLPGQRVPLEDVNKEIRKIEEKTNPPLNTEIDPATLEASVETAETPNVSTVPVDVAKTLLRQAELMEQDLKAYKIDIDTKRAEAYSMAPELQPKKGPGRPKKVI